MDAGALRGKILGTCTLQGVLGSGTMGAVYLAVQSQPPRQVAVKVLLRAASLDLLQQIEFLESFREEIALVSSLEHPHIVSVSAYGDIEGLAYLVMPYIAGETLEDMLAREGALPLPKAASYLEQIAAALDYAHQQGVLHRDLKPANILLTPDGSLLLADFHLTKMLIEGKTAHMRLSRPGMLDYMSPEQVLGKEVDSRSDLYSLGAILYHMVTGTPPFQGQTLMKVATKHLKMPPPSPRALRGDLPAAAEQAILAALAKTPAERYARAQDLALIFRRAVQTGPLIPTGNDAAGSAAAPSAMQISSGAAQQATVQGVAPQLAPSQEAPSTQHDTTGMRLYTPGGHSLASLPTHSVQTPSRRSLGSNLFDPKWRTGVFNAADSQSIEHGSASTDALSIRHEAAVSNGSLPMLPVSTDRYVAFEHPAPIHPVTRPEVQRAVGRDGVEASLSAPVINPVTPIDQTVAVQQTKGDADHVPTLPGSEQQYTQNGSVTGTLKLTGPAKIISIPVAGQPGQYRTGILPTTLPPIQQLPAPATPPSPRGSIDRARGVGAQLIAPTSILLALLVVISSVTFWLTHTSPGHSPSPPRATAVIGKQPDLAASSTARALATLEANTILYDPLAQNIRSWPVVTSGTVLYQFIDGAYHISNNDPLRIAPAVLQDETLNQPYAYSLTMEEIRGDDNSPNNQFGMILRFTSQEKNGNQFVSFYTLEVLNTKGGEYQFWQYDTSQTATTSPWKELAHHPFGSEFHQGQGPKSLNTFKILVNGKNFTLIVNGKQVWTVQDGSLASGSVGMLVNLKGTEVAFSDLRLTYS